MRKLADLTWLICLMGVMSFVTIRPVNHVCAQYSNGIVLHVDGSTFFIDNEYFGDRVSGYTLPGFVLQPKVEWHLDHDVTLEKPSLSPGCGLAFKEAAFVNLISILFNLLFIILTC